MRQKKRDIENYLFAWFTGDSPRHHPDIAALVDPLFACGGKRGIK
jgi:hypothetical protein